MHIWTLALGAKESLAKELISDCRMPLSEDECARADRFMFDKDRNRYTMAHALCRLMLSRFGQVEPAEWQFDKEERGRPFIASDMNSTNLDFNLSHTQGMVGCALSDKGRIGFDLEPKDRQANLEALASKQFSLMEQKQFSAAPNERIKAQRFFQFWTLKESYIKLTGKGLSENLSAFGFDLAENKPECYVGQSHLEDHEFGLFDVGEKHQGAWAHRSLDIKVKNIPMQPDHTHFSLESFLELL